MQFAVFANTESHDQTKVLRGRTNATGNVIPSNIVKKNLPLFFITLEVLVVYNKLPWSN